MNTTHSQYVQNVLNRLPEVRFNGNEWRARCPAHGGDGFNLTVSEGHDGRALLVCWSKGCSAKAIRTALGLSPREAFPSGSGNAARRVPGTPSIGRPLPKRPKKVHASVQHAIRAVLWGLNRNASRQMRHTGTWSYRTDLGHLYAKVLRFDASDGNGKEYRPIHVNGEGWSIGDPPYGWLPYRVNELPQSIPTWIVEGEKSADALWSVGIPATTSAHGCKSPHKTWWGHLSGERCIGWPDNHGPGIAYIEAVQALLAELSPPVPVKLITPPKGLPEGGDAADYIEYRRGVKPEMIRKEIRALAAGK